MGDGRRMEVVSGRFVILGRVGFLVLAREHVSCSSSMIRYPVLDCADPISFSRESFRSGAIEKTVFHFGIHTAEQVL
jgi:hypothetical protein